MPLLPSLLLRVSFLLPLLLADELDTASMCAEPQIMLPLLLDAIELFGNAGKKLRQLLRSAAEVNTASMLLDAIDLFGNVSAASIVPKMGKSICSCFWRHSRFGNLFFHARRILAQLQQCTFQVN